MPPLRAFPLGWQIWRSSGSRPSVLEEVQRLRLADLVRFVRVQSPFFRQLYKRLPPDVSDLRSIPVVTRPELMADFDSWLTDRALTRKALEPLLERDASRGLIYEGRYAVWTSSGVTGEPGIFLHDRDALLVYGILMAVRGFLAWMSPLRLLAALRRGGRQALILATHRPFAGASFFELGRKLFPRLSQLNRSFSVLLPMPELVSSLNRFQPAILVGYPTALSLLAEERLRGRLGIRPLLVVTAGEWLGPGAQRKLSLAFDCSIREVYATSEFMGIAFSCAHGWLHLNSDWLVLEPVDARYQPVPPGALAHTVLLTNLANRIQPLIRYDLGDSIMVGPSPCPCGRPLPAFRVEGRRDEILCCRGPRGERVQLPPLAVSSVVEETRGVHRFQVIQRDRDRLRLRLEVIRGEEKKQVWKRASERLRNYLSIQGLPNVVIEPDHEPPSPEPASGKFRQVWVDGKSEEDLR